MLDLKNNNSTTCFVISDTYLVYQFSLGQIKQNREDYTRLLFVIKNCPSKLDHDDIHCDEHTNLIKHLYEIKL